MITVDLIMDSIRYYLKSLSKREKLEALELLLDTIRDYKMFIETGLAK